MFVVIIHMARVVYLCVCLYHVINLLQTVFYLIDDKQTIISKHRSRPVSISNIAEPRQLFFYRKLILEIKVKKSGDAQELALRNLIV